MSSSCDNSFSKSRFKLSDESNGESNGESSDESSGSFDGSNNSIRDLNSGIVLLIFEKYCEKYDSESYIYKVCSHKNDENVNRLEWFVVLKYCDDTINTEERNVIDKKYAKYRANKLFVVDIINRYVPSYKRTYIINSDEGIEQRYEINKIIECDNFDEDIDKVYGNGVHYFKTPKGAFYYKRCMKNGVFYEWYDDGQIKTEINLLNGREEGLVTEWFENGNIRCEANFIKGKVEGLVTSWNENCKKNFELNYVKGNIIKSITWNENGGIILMKAINEKREGFMIELNENGEIKSEIIYYANEKIGNSLLTGSYQNGQKMFEINYAKEKIIKLIVWDEEGKVFLHKEKSDNE